MIATANDGAGLRLPTPEEARAHPILWGMFASRGVFQPAEHLWHLADALLKVETGEIKRLAISYPPQHGKALADDTPMLTARGWTTHGALVPGDLVHGPDGRMVRVLDVTAPFADDTYRVTFSDGRSIVAGARHEWIVDTDREGKPGRREEVLETRALLDRQRRAPGVRVAAPVERPPAVLPIDPYTLGVWLGDGVARDGFICAGDQDAAHFAALGEAREVKPGAWLVRVPGLRRALRLAGLLNAKRIPDDYFTASADQRRALLQGLMDTDGSCSARGQAEFCNTDHALADGVRRLVESLGMRAAMIVGRATLAGRDCGPKWRVMFTPAPGDHVFRLARKQSRTRGRGARYRFVRSVERVDPVPLRCIQVEGGVYLAGHAMIATHNSWLTSRYYPGWLLGRHPQARILQISYSQDLIHESTAVARDSLAHHGLDVFGVQTWSRARRGSWDLYDRHGFTTGGGCRGVGRNGTVGGRPADYAIVDDLIRDRREANNAKLREAIWEWLEAVVFVRAQRLILIATRWHEDDPIGRIIQRQAEGSMGEPWTIVNVPAVSDGPGDPLGRAKGAGLWPERYPGDWYAKKEAEVQSYTWEALYQGRPTPKGGGTFKAEWFRRYSFEDGGPEGLGIVVLPETTGPDGVVVPGERIPVAHLRRFATCDLSTSKRTDGDSTALACWGKHRPTGRLFLLEMVHGHIPATKLLATMRACVDRWKLGIVYVEQEEYQLDAIKFLQAAQAIELPVVGMDAVGDKVTRAMPASAAYQGGRVWHRRGAKWLARLEDELVGFPAGHDDQVDAVSYGVIKSGEMRRAEGSGVVVTSEDLPDSYAIGRGGR